MENVFHRTLYDTWNKLSTLWLKLNHVVKGVQGEINAYNYNGTEGPFIWNFLLSFHMEFQGSPIAPTIILREISYEVRVKIFIWMTPQLCRAKLAA